MELFRNTHTQDAIDAFSAQDDDARGAVYTRRAVAEVVLDVVGYTPDRPLHTLRLLEPSFGRGVFLLAALDRLLAAWTAARPSGPARDLAPCLRGVEIHAGDCAHTRAALQARLLQHGLTRHDADALLDAWLIRDDFLLTPLPSRFDAVVGNPPYVRQESIPAPLLKDYKKRYTTLTHRADLYVPFFEHSVHLLTHGGRLGFVCTDRWLKNTYGGPLRKLLAATCHLTDYIDLNGAQVFQSEVLAYPSIAVLERAATHTAHPTRVVRCDDADALPALLQTPPSPPSTPQPRVTLAYDVASGDAPWLLHALSQLRLLRRIERAMPTLEDAQCKVGIGVATGCDEVYIGPHDALDVEPSRKLRLVKPQDLSNTAIQWQGLGLINPYEPSGALADLDRYPRFGAYMRAHSARLKARYVARKQPHKWYKTIDRVYADLTSTPKLLIPDIKGEPTVVYDAGHFYPHHNLYTVTSQAWDLRALQAILRSSVALLCVAAYSVRMSGGFLRFQAQYLRRIRLPPWDTLTPDTQRDLRAVASAPIDRVDRVVFPLYGIASDEADDLIRWTRQARASKT